METPYNLITMYYPPRIALRLLALLLLVTFAHMLPAQQVRNSGDARKKLTQAKMIRFDAFTGRYTPEWHLSGGVGLLSTFFKDKGRSSVPPLRFCLGYRFAPTFSLEAMFGYSRTETQLPVSLTRTYSSRENRFSMIALRPTGHLRINYRAEAFGGLLIAYQHNRVKPLKTLKGSVHNPSIQPAEGLFLTAFIGTR